MTRQIFFASVGSVMVSGGMGSSKAARWERTGMHRDGSSFDSGVTSPGLGAQWQPNIRQSSRRFVKPN